MIQRIQTIWLLLASAAMFATLKLPFYSGTHPGLLPPYSAVVQTLNATDNFGTLVLTSLLGTGIFMSIFLFKNRMLQFRICIFAILLELVVLFLYYNQIHSFATGSISWSALFHPFFIISLFLAARGIYKDEKLIKDSNRLR